MSMGTIGVTEFLFDKSKIKNKNLKLGFRLMTVQDPDSIVTMSARNLMGYGSHSLVSGSPERSYSFDVVSWLPVLLD